MKVESVAECSPYTFDLIKLSFVIKIFVLSVFEWPFYTGFTVTVLWLISTSKANFSLSLLSHSNFYLCM